MPLVVEILDHYVQGGGVATDGGLGIAAIEGGRVVVANGGGGWLMTLWRVMMVKA